MFLKQKCHTFPVNFENVTININAKLYFLKSKMFSNSPILLISCIVYFLRQQGARAISPGMLPIELHRFR